MLKTSEPVNWDKFPYGCNLHFSSQRPRNTTKTLQHSVCSALSEKTTVCAGELRKKDLQNLNYEIAPPGTIIETVRISPRPPVVSYALSLTSDSIYLIINPLTGVISTVLQFTTLKQQLFNLEVMETISGITAKVQITIEGC